MAGMSEQEAIAAAAAELGQTVEWVESRRFTRDVADLINRLMREGSGVETAGAAQSSAPVPSAAEQKALKDAWVEFANSQNEIALTVRDMDVLVREFGFTAEGAQPIIDFFRNDRATRPAVDEEGNPTPVTSIWSETQRLRGEGWSDDDIANQFRLLPQGLAYTPSGVELAPTSQRLIWDAATNQYRMSTEPGLADRNGRIQTDAAGKRFVYDTAGWAFLADLDDDQEMALWERMVNVGMLDAGASRTDYTNAVSGLLQAANSAGLTVDALLWNVEGQTADQTKWLRQQVDASNRSYVPQATVVAYGQQAARSILGRDLTDREAAVLARTYRVAEYDDEFATLEARLPGGRTTADVDTLTSPDLWAEDYLRSQFKTEADAVNRFNAWVSVLGEA